MSFFLSSSVGADDVLGQSNKQVLVDGEVLEFLNQAIGSNGFQDIDRGNQFNCCSEDPVFEVNFFKKIVNFFN